MAMQYLKESQKTTPIIADVDVAVVGGGAAGFVAAIAAAREGASTVLIERFGTLGGCMGTGGWAAGAVYFSDFDRTRFPPHTYYGWSGASRQLGQENIDFIRTCGITGEWIARVLDLDNQFGPSPHRVASSMRVSHVCSQMVQEAGINLMLSTYAGDPIMEDEHIVRGLTVHNTDGRGAIRAGVTIDTTGNSGFAARTYAPLMQCNWQPSMNITFIIAGCDDAKFAAFMANRPTVPDHLNQWIDEVLIPDATYTQGRLGAHLNRMRPVADLVRQAREEDGYEIIGHIGNIGRIAVVFPWGSKCPQNGLFCERADIEGKIDTLDAEHMSLVEYHARRYMTQTTGFFRKYVPGFENAYLLYTSPYIGTRGGRAIEAERVITEEDRDEGRRFDDVIYEFGEGLTEPSNVPFRQLIPNRVENLLAAGVSAHRKPPNLRCRESVMKMGHAAGITAAMSVHAGVAPRKIDVHQLQKKLIDSGVNFGDARHAT